MQKIERLEDKSWVANGNMLFNLDTLPGGKRVRRLMLYCNVSGTKDAADTLAAELFPRVFASIRLGNFVNIPGMHLYLLNWAMYGRKVMPGTAVPGSGTTFNVNFALEIPFRDPRQPGSDDGSIPTELLVGKALEVTNDAANVYGVGNLVITAGTFNLSAELVEETNTPQLCRIGYIDPNSATAQLDPGIYKELLLCELTTQSITTAEITSVDLDVDGKPVLNNATHQQLLHHWNSAAGTSDQLTANTAAFIPLIFHDRSGKSNLTKQPLVQGKGKVQIAAGTLTSGYRLAYWRAEPKSQSDVERIAQAIGAPADATSYEPAVSKPSAGTADKLGQVGRATTKSKAMFAYLPGKFRKMGNPTSRSK